ncbi:hypothetical protein V565_165130 [Rhizoctonia solani 123E]|uniref:Uncharacterized protein n=1 Tax=Rhizoctonia solani 123E TaxID=1423351 RepID=A0A074RK42_9AGAM|nr:hypothetical protein V565_165130 [Rhizoctonia solani 123E]
MSEGTVIDLAGLVFDTLVHGAFGLAPASRGGSGGWGIDDRGDGPDGDRRVVVGGRLVRSGRGNSGSRGSRSSRGGRSGRGNGLNRGLARNVLEKCEKSDN